MFLAVQNFVEEKKEEEKKAEGENKAEVRRDSMGHVISDAKESDGAVVDGSNNLLSVSELKGSDHEKSEDPANLDVDSKVGESEKSDKDIASTEVTKFQVPGPVLLGQ